MAVDAGDGDLVGVTAFFLGPSGDWRRLNEQSSSKQNVGITDGRLGPRYPQGFTSCQICTVWKATPGKAGGGEVGLIERTGPSIAIKSRMILSTLILVMGNPNLGPKELPYIA